MAQLCANVRNIKKASESTLITFQITFREAKQTQSPLGRLMGEFVEYFQWRYASSSNSKQNLPYAVDDITSFLDDLHKKITYILGDAAPVVGQYNLMYLLKTIILKRTYKTLFTLYKEIVSAMHVFNDKFKPLEKKIFFF